MRRPGEIGWIYFVRDSGCGWIKIGYTADNPQTRINRGQAFNPRPLKLIGLIRGDEILESELHHRFVSARRFREWFEPTAELIAYISANTCALPEPTRRYYCAVCGHPSIKGKQCVWCHRLPPRRNTHVTAPAPASASSSAASASGDEPKPASRF